jgi:hypothetical protein
MKVSNKQLIMLYQIAAYVSSLNMSGNAWNPPFTADCTRELVNQIINQQSNDLIEIE